jgi:hypothetical protein
MKHKKEKRRFEKRNRMIQWRWMMKWKEKRQRYAEKTKKRG